MSTIPTLPPQAGNAISAATITQLIADVQMLKNMRVGPAMGLQRVGAGIAIQQNQQNIDQREQYIPIKLTGVGESDGLYTWCEQRWDPDTEDWVPNDNGLVDTTAGEAREINNLADLSTGDGSQIYYARPSRYIFNGTSVVWEFDGRGGGTLLPVKVFKVSGDEGSKTTVCTFKYDVYTLAGTLIHAAVAVERPRPKGKMIGQVEGYGAGFYVGSDFKLWDPGEIPATSGCV